MCDYETNYKKALAALMEGERVDFRAHCVDDGKGLMALVADIPGLGEYCLYLGPSIEQSWKSCNYRKALEALMENERVDFRIHCVDDGKGLYALVADIPSRGLYCLYLGPSVRADGL